MPDDNSIRVTFVIELKITRLKNKKQVMVIWVPHGPTLLSPITFTVLIFGSCVAR